MFFCFLIAATMPKYTTPSTPEELAAVELSAEYICLAASNVETYPGRLYSSADFAAGTISAGDPDAKFDTCRVVLPPAAGRYIRHHWPDGHPCPARVCEW